MKKSIMLCLSFMVLAIGSYAQKTTKTKTALQKDSFTVNGVCGMCKTTIEKAAKKAGAVKAVWNPDTHVLAVEFQPAKTSVVKMQKAIAAAGYDNDGALSSDAAYEKLHACCKYDRVKEEEKKVSNQ